MIQRDVCVNHKGGLKRVCSLFHENRAWLKLADRFIMESIGDDTRATAREGLMETQKVAICDIAAEGGMSVLF